ncbi:MAG: GtrA family protein [Alsobacter sp.]
MAHVHSAIPFVKAESRLRGLPPALRRLAAPLHRLSRTPLGQAFLRFLGVGVVGLAVDASIFALLDRFHVAPEWSRAVSLALATVVTWRLNRRHTFGASGRALHVEALRYGAVTLVAQGFSYSVFLLLVYELPALPRILSLLVGAGLAAVAGFAGHKLFAFAPVRRTAA